MNWPHFMPFEKFSSWCRFILLLPIYFTSSRTDSLQHLTMDTMTSAEKVTKLLRAKNATAESVVPIASDLLLGSVSVYLPNASQFVFDLICDRMNDLQGKAFKNWKYSADLWQLWKSCWIELGKTDANLEVRARSFANVKILQVILDVMDKATQDSAQIESTPKSSKKHTKGQALADTQAVPAHHSLLPDSHQQLSSMFDCLDTFMKTGYILVDEFSTMGLLKSYFKLLSLLDDSNKEYEHWTEIVGNLYLIPRQSVIYKPSKKAYAKYYSEVLPVSLAILADSSKTILQIGLEFCHSIMCQILFEENSPSIISHVKTQEEFIGKLSDSEIEYLYKEALQSLAPNDVTHCETLYSAFTKNRLRDLCTSLLSSLSKLNRVLSPKVCKELFDNELKNANVNWLLIAQLMSIDATLALNSWRVVVDKASLCQDFDKIARNVALGFVRAREYLKFLSQVFPYAIQKSSAWNTEDNINVLSSYVDELSGNQINQLLVDFIEKELVSPLFLVVNGLLSCSLSKQDAVKLSLLVPKLRAFDDPRLTYYVLCLYGEEAVIDQSQGSKNKKKSNNYFDLCLTFRIAELTGDIALIQEKSTKSLIKALKGAEFSSFLNRWIVMIEQIPEIHPEVLKALFTLSPDIVAQFFTSQAINVFELPTVLENLLKHFTSNPGLFDKYADLFPNVVIRKYFADQVARLCADLKKKPSSLAILRILSYILKEPTLTYAIETDVDFLLAIVRSSNSESLSLALDIASNVWKAHVKSIKTPRSEAYLSKLTAILIESLSNSKSKDLELTKCVLSQRTPEISGDLEKLAEEYVIFVEKNFKKKDFGLQVEALLGIPFLSQKARKVGRSILKSGGNLEVPKNLTPKIFDLATKTHESSSATYLSSLFVAIYQDLDPEGQLSLIHSFTKFTMALSPDNLHVLHFEILQSFEDSTDSSLHLLLDLLVIMLSGLKKADEKSNSTQIALLKTSLSAISTALPRCKSHDTLIRVIGGLSTAASRNGWAFEQYVVELYLELMNSIFNNLTGTSAEEIFTLTASAFSNLFLNQRFKFAARYHLVCSIMTKSMELLCGSGILLRSVMAATEYKRILVSLCEPQTFFQTSDPSQLTSQAALLKTAFRKHAHIILANFVSIHLSNPFVGEVYDIVIDGVYSLCGLLGSEELKLVRQYLDSQGRTYFQTLYNEFKNGRLQRKI
ncbi:hypothetical protein PUMCH_002089 [Australozyma saopauloensis]|uniref:Nucleolar 27S pre-rRNA processing Urb2/Npa2 C-terminal domain-containing protein n=1 Tax=Australozyma saopauloensis TaxID=291208 RepID=A0AAX4H8H8_9ASCO|nr:hypothetical protein PUMCH_002089 [[Candida] saopauloensis]